LSTLADYLAFADAHPELFANPPGAGFKILREEADIQKAELEAAQQLKGQGLPTEWARVGIAFQDQYAIILRDAVCCPDGSLGTYTRGVGGIVPGVIVLPIYQGQVLLISHFRHATRTWHLEIPRGFGTKGLYSEENAKKEVKEEVEGNISRLVPLGHIYPDTGVGAGYNDFFYADIETYGQPEANEGISEILPIPLAEFERMIRDNEITDGFTITAYALAKTRGLL
jgi:ADP-ribose pyrophosphatase